MQLAAGLGGLHERGSGHHDLLRSVVVLSAFALVLGGLDLGLFVGGVQILNDVGVELLNLLFQGRETLYFARIHTSREGLR